MSRSTRWRRLGRSLVLGCAAAASPILLPGRVWAGPTADAALALMPVQKDVEFDRPKADEIAKCTIDVEKIGGRVGWVVKDPQGIVIRRFIDTNGDNTVDQWSYYDGGLEVYRDIDSNANGKADQCRWLNTGGTRWGVDTDEDGKIDSWKSISAEEVSAEAVAAMAGRDAARFQRLLLTTDELKSLNVGEKFGAVIGDKIAAAPKRFTGLMSETTFSTVATETPKWINFSGTRPGIVPAGTEGTTKDLLVYENVAAMMEVGGKTGQVQIGTMIKLDDVWRLVDVPAPVGNEQQITLAPLFFSPSTLPGGVAGTAAGPADDAGREAFDKLEAIEKQLVAATDAKQLTDLKKQRAELIINTLLPSLKAKEDRTLWSRQLVDAYSEGISSGTNPDFVAEMKTFEAMLSAGNEPELVSYARFSRMTADYIRAQSVPNADFNKVQGAWLDSLREFVKEFPKSGEAAEAMLHLAIDAEFAGKDAEALAIYSQIIGQFPQAGAAKKATGAMTRLNSVGKTLALKGTTVDGRKFDLAALAGKTVVLHYWDSKNPAALTDMAALKEIQAKFAREGVTIVGISLDTDQQQLAGYLQQARITWTQLWEAGGMEGRFANEMGILTLPTILLVDAGGKVVNRGLHISQLDGEITTLVRGKK